MRIFVNIDEHRTSGRFNRARRGALTELEVYDFDKT